MQSRVCCVWLAWISPQENRLWTHPITDQILLIHLVQRLQKEEGSLGLRGGREAEGFPWAQGQRGFTGETAQPALYPRDLTKFSSPGDHVQIHQIISFYTSFLLRIKYTKRHMSKCTEACDSVPAPCRAPQWEQSSWSFQLTSIPLYLVIIAIVSFIRAICIYFLFPIPLQTLDGEGPHFNYLISLGT